MSGKASRKRRQSGTATAPGKAAWESVEPNTTVTAHAVPKTMLQFFPEVTSG